MDLFSTNNSRRKPLFFMGDKPVSFAATLVIVYLSLAIAELMIGNAWKEILGFLGLRALHGEVWRFISYPLVPGMDNFLGFIFGLFLVYWSARVIEENWSRLRFGVIYFAGVLVPSAVEAIAGLAFQNPMYPLVGADTAHFCLLLTMVFLMPNAPIFVEWIRLKHLGLLSFVLHLIAVASRQDGSLFVGFLLACAITYGLCRGYGVSFQVPRMGFASPKERALAQQRRIDAKRAGKNMNLSPDLLYEPKIQPRALISDEHPAVEKIDFLLEKIGREGINSLTEAEKKMLERASSDLKAMDEDSKKR
jgi:hypothetical protein